LFGELVWFQNAETIRLLLFFDSFAL
jgi:hypothetical protein